MRAIRWMPSGWGDGTGNAREDAKVADSTSVRMERIRFEPQIEKVGIGVQRDR